MSLAGQRDGQVDAHRGLADTALPAGYGDDPCGGADCRRLGTVTGTEPSPAHQLGALLLVHDRDRHGDVADVGERLDPADGVPLDLISHRARCHRERDADGHRGAVEPDVSNHAEVDDVTPQLWVDHASQRGLDVGNVHHGNGTLGVGHGVFPRRP